MNRERKEKHKRLEEEREAVRQQLREKYNLEKPSSIEEPMEDSESESESSSGEEEEEEESLNKDIQDQEELLEKLASEL